MAQPTIEELLGVPRLRERTVALGRRPGASGARAGTLVVDLFCGVGGFSEGARLAGHSVVLAVDRDEQLLRAHHANHPGALHLKMALGEETEAALVARIRALVPEGREWHLHGSPPCTRLSNMQAVKRKGAVSEDVDAGMQTVLWFLDFALRIAPTTWSFEQVPTPEIDGVLRLAKYQNPSTLDFVHALDLSRLGVPQKRARTLAGSPALLARVRASTGRCAPALRSTLAPPPEAHYCLASTGRVVDHAHTVMLPDGSCENESVRHGCYRSIDEVAATCCTKPHRWVRSDFTTIRSFSVREQAALQTYPPAYKFPRRAKDAYASIGNALPPLVASVMVGPPMH